MGLIMVNTTKPLERRRATQRKPGVAADGRHVGTSLAVVPRSQLAPVPDPPAHLKATGVEVWERVWRAGWWLHTEQDGYWVEVIASSYDEIEEYRATVERDGLVQTGSQGQPVAHPLIAEIRKAQALALKCLGTLGMSPSDRARLALGQAKVESELAKLRGEAMAKRSRAATR